MNTQKKAEWKGMFKGVVVTLLLLCVFSAGAVYAGVTLMTDEGFFVGDTSMTDGVVTINSTEITDDSFGGVMFLTYGDITQNVYAVDALVDDETIILEIYDEVVINPEGDYIFNIFPSISANAMSCEGDGFLKVGIAHGIWSIQKTVGDDLLTGMEEGDFDITLYTCDGWGYDLLADEGYTDTGLYVTAGNTYYAYFLSYATTTNAAGSVTCDAYVKNVTGVGMFH